MSASSGFVGFAGSRSLPVSARPLVASVVRSVVAAGRGVAVGCASGGDAFALVPALLSGARVRVFAVGGPSGRGFWRFSASGLVGSAARVFGAPVVWWAGGRCGCPSCSGSGGGRCPSLVSRLRRRSLAFVRFVAGSGSGAGLVAFVSSPGSRGSFLSVRAAAGAGLPVVVFPVGFAAARLPVLPGGGRWVPAASSGVWARGFRWVPAGPAPDDTPTTVVHCKRDEYDVYIGRPSKWGNPFVVGQDGDRETVIEKYRAWIMEQDELLADLHELRGKRLGCWCAPQACHGDVLAELADGLQVE